MTSAKNNFTTSMLKDRGIFDKHVEIRYFLQMFIYAANPTGLTVCSQLNNTRVSHQFDIYIFNSLLALPTLDLQVDLLHLRIPNCVTYLSYKRGGQKNLHDSGLMKRLT